MEIKYIRSRETKQEQIRGWLGDSDWLSRYRPYKKIKSLKRARKAHLRYNRRWSDADRDRELLNWLYRYARPGSKINDCFLGNAIVKGAKVTLDQDTGRIESIQLIGEDGRYSCDILNGGGCCGKNWYTYLSDENGNWLASIEHTESGDKVWTGEP
jgi:hypothetical protein